MGNCPACLSSELVHHSNEPGEEEEEEEMVVRVIRTTDNELFEFPGPIFVRDLLFGFQGFAVFPNKAKKKQQPLHPNTQLKFSHIYYLKPWVKSSFLNPLVNHGYKNHNSLLVLPKHTSANKPWLPLINPLINTKHGVNQPLINPLINTYNCLHISDNHLNSTANHINHLSSTANYHLNDSDDPLNQTTMSSATPLFNELAGTLTAIIAPDGALNELAGDLIAVNIEDKALNGLQGDLLVEPAENLITMNAQDQSSSSELAEGFMTINDQDHRAFNEVGSMALNAQESALNELAEGFIKTNAQEKSSSSDVVLIESPSKQGKVMKKVRFTEEVVLITSPNQLGNQAAAAAGVTPKSLSITSGGERNTHSYYASSSGGGERNPNTYASSSGGRNERNTHSCASNDEIVSQFDKQIPCFGASKEGFIPYTSKKEIHGVVRLKVVISKKQLTELMSTRASEKESDALMERVLSPLLSPTSSSLYKSDSLNGAFHSPPPWRPSLNHISEDHTSQELI